MALTAVDHATGGLLEPYHVQIAGLPADPADLVSFRKQICFGNAPLTGLSRVSTKKNCFDSAVVDGDLSTGEATWRRKEFCRGRTLPFPFSVESVLLKTLQVETRDGVVPAAGS